MPYLNSRPLLTGTDLPRPDIAKICQRWGVRGMAVDSGRKRPQPVADYLLADDPFADVDLYLIANFGPGDFSWHFKKHHFAVAADLNLLLGCRVWIDDQEVLEMHIEDGKEWARQEMECYPSQSAAESKHR